MLRMEGARLSQNGYGCYIYVYIYMFFFFEAVYIYIYICYTPSRMFGCGSWKTVYRGERVYNIYI